MAVVIRSGFVVRSVGRSSASDEEGGARSAAHRFGVCVLDVVADSHPDGRVRAESGTWSTRTRRGDESAVLIALMGYVLWGYCRDDPCISHGTSQRVSYAPPQV